jgi:hypothetical protein
MARLPIATPIPHPIATPIQIQKPMDLVPFLPHESLIESLYFEVEKTSVAGLGRSVYGNRRPFADLRYRNLEPFGLTASSSRRVG